MSSPLTLENSLILACVRTEPDVQRIRELVERCPEWSVIVQKADRWRVVPSVYLRGGAPNQAAYQGRWRKALNTSTTGTRSVASPSETAACGSPPVRRGERARHCLERGGAGNHRLPISRLETYAGESSFWCIAATSPEVKRYFGACVKRLARRWEGLRATLYSTYVMTSSVKAAWKRCQRPSASRSRTFGGARVLSR